MTSNPVATSLVGSPQASAPWTGPDPIGPDAPAPEGTARPGADRGGTRVAADADSPPVSRRVVAASLGLLLIATGVLYLWGLSASGYANSFYSAAAQAGGVSWKAWFFGSLDSANAITVDKPPASLWLMGLSVRLFGLSSWSILAPQALLGVASVATLYATVVRVLTGGPVRTSADGAVLRERTPLSVRGHVAALLGAVVFALTPVAVLMFRFNNPDALLTFCLLLATYLTLRATERAQARWLVAAGVVIGLGFLTKTLQAFVILPALVAAYLVAAPVGWGKRLLHLGYALAAMVVSFGWYIAVVELVPASMRPYIGGSQNNSFLELTLGYNGLGRITGDETGSVTGGAAGAGAGGNTGGMWGESGPLRMFSGVSGGMVSWLIPAALILGIAALVFLRRRPRTDLLRAAIIAFGGWLVVMMAVFSFMAGIYHDYYTISLAPAIGALLALGAYGVWEHRRSPAGRLVLAGTMAVTTAWSVVLLSQATGIYLTLRWPVIALGALATGALVALPHAGRRLRALVLGAALTAALIGPAAYAANTVATPHTGSIVTAGPVSGGGPGGQGGMGRARNVGGAPGAMDGQGLPPGADGRGSAAFAPGLTPGGTGPGGLRPGGMPPGGLSATGLGQIPGGAAEQGMGGGAGGLLNGAQVSDEMATLLTTDADAYTWVAASIGAQNAASYQLATQLPVMAIGGFNGSDPSPTLAQFQQYVAAGRVHWFISGGMGGQQNGGSNSAGEISSWVAAKYTAQTVGGTTVYDLSQPTD